MPTSSTRPDVLIDIDTNAGPFISARPFPSLAAAKRYMEQMIPLLRRRGYSFSWRRSNGWHVIDCRNSRGRIVHSAALRRSPDAD